MKYHLGALVCIVLILPSVAMGRPEWLIATSGEPVSIKGALKLEVVRPDESTPWPASLLLKVVSIKGLRMLVLYPEKGLVENGNRHVYVTDFTQQMGEILSIGLADVSSNSLLLSDVDPLADNIKSSMQRLEPMPGNEPALSVLEPVYFVTGTGGGSNSHFQLSFKYRLFDPEATPVQWFPELSKVHFGYTQTTSWDMNANSMPFHDTSYRPGFFWQSKLDEKNTIGPSYLRSGFEHESNGKDGVSSRSINIFYIQPVLRKDFAIGDSLFFAPRFYGYINQDGNSDIASYRGYVDWQVRYGDEHGWLLSSRIRTGTAGYGSAQLDMSVPLRKPLFSRTGGFLYFQLFTGYGENLLDYNLKSQPQLRVGFSIVR